MATTPGYSGKPLAAKLGIKEGSLLLLKDAPADYQQLLGTAAAGVEFKRRAGTDIDIAHVFVTRRAKLAEHLTALRAALRPDASIWVSWPKQSSKAATDLTDNVIREIALPLGFVDIKVCAVSDTWSGLKLVVRKGLR